jgi:hypothetical protein
MLAEGLVRRSVAVAAATGVGGWLSLMNLAVPGGGHTGPGTGWYLVIGALGIAAVSALVRWHALWLIPATTAAFAVTYEQWFWDKPRGVPDSGMDAIGYHPTDAVWAVLPFPLAAALILAGYSAYTPWWRERR